MKHQPMMFKISDRVKCVDTFGLNPNEDLKLYGIYTINSIEYDHGLLHTYEYLRLEEISGLWSSSRFELYNIDWLLINKEFSF